MTQTMSKLEAVRAALAREPGLNAKQLVRELRRAGVKLPENLVHNYLSVVRREMREAGQGWPYLPEAEAADAAERARGGFITTLDLLTRAKVLIAEAGGYDRFRAIVEAAFGS